MTTREAHIATNKSLRQNPLNSANIGNPSIMSQFQGIPSRTAAEQEEPQKTTIFHDEISDIMRGYGDCDHPLEDSVKLVEKILQQQLRGILFDAIEVARRRGKAIPGQIDFEFLMRKHPTKINRMRKHIKLQKSLRLHRQLGQIEDLEDNQDPDEEPENEIPERYDEEKIRRMIRADRISQILNGTQYCEYNKARHTSLYCRHSERMKLKFKSFLNLPTHIQLPSYCLNILAYFAHETIAVLVDFAILTRLNSENRLTEPYSRVTPSGTSYNMLHIAPEVAQGRGQDGVKPITVQEILEAVRRFTQFAQRGIGFYKNRIHADMSKCYLAI